MPRNVCYLTTVHDARDVRVLYREAASVLKQGYRVRLIAQNASDIDVGRIEGAALRPPRNRLGRMLCTGARALVLAMREKADIYHLHDPELIPLGLLLRLMHRRVIYDVHEDLPKQILAKPWIPAFLRPLVSWVVDRIETIAARAFNGIVAATAPVAVRFPPAKTVVIRNYPVLSMFETAEIGRGADAGRPPVLIYVGSISEDRGAVDMVRALEHLDPSVQARLEFVGGWTPPALRRRVEGMPCGSMVTSRGWMPPVEVYRRLQEAAIGLVCLRPIPRYVESLPVKLFEYMAAGLPVIASDFPHWREIVEGNACGLTVDPLDPKAIAKAIEHLIRNPKEAQRMGQNGRRAVEQRYNWEQESRRLITLYNSLFGGR